MDGWFDRERLESGSHYTALPPMMGMDGWMKRMDQGMNGEDGCNRSLQEKWIQDKCAACACALAVCVCLAITSRTAMPHHCRSHNGVHVYVHVAYTDQNRIKTMHERLIAIPPVTFNM